MNKLDELNKLKNEKNFQKRGIAFESFLLNIFNEERILIKKSYRTSNKEQIDGCIEINGRIFLLEIKWENSETISASKIYSFLGKINSKINGTLGIFISYNKLSKNTKESIRNGLPQNIFIIDGEETIEKLISNNYLWKDYIWYLFRQASTRNITYIEIDEFITNGTLSPSVISSYWDTINSLLKNDKSKEEDIIIAIQDIPENELFTILKKILSIYPYLNNNTINANIIQKFSIKIFRKLKKSKTQIKISIKNH